MNFTAWYPVGEGTDANTFTVPTSYADVNAMAATDYMVYSGTQNKTSGNGVTLTMNRKMARIVITPVLNDEFATGYSITGIKVHANTSGYANGEPQTGDIQVLALKQGNAYYALLAPTTAADATFLTVTVTDGTNSQNLTVKGIPATEAGKSYDYTLTVGKDKATIGNVEVNPWTDGTAIPGGEAVEEEKEIPYVTFRAASEQTLDLVQTESQMLDDEGYPVYKDDEESIPVLVPNPYPGYDGDTGYIEYSVGNSNVWTKFTPESEAVEFGGEKGDLRLRGISPKGTLQAQIVFGDTTSVACSGDIRTLVDWENYATADTDSAIFRGLFENCSVLTSAPELPATTLAPYCYYSMFVGCTRLNAAPALPATDLAENCYKSMFYGCTSLKVAPELPATTLANQCYGMMFAGCTNLAAAPVLSATNLANDCYNGMFVSCTSLTSAPVLSATILANNCYNGMFNYCINLASAPELPATTLKPGCYAGMFMNCTSLTSAPELPATTLVDYCYHQMFIHCTNLNSVTMLATDISASNCLTNWMSGVSATGTFTKAASMTTLPTGESGIPSGWIVQN